MCVGNPCRAKCIVLGWRRLALSRRTSLKLSVPVFFSLRVSVWSWRLTQDDDRFFRQRVSCSCHSRCGAVVSWRTARARKKRRTSQEVARTLLPPAREACVFEAAIRQRISGSGVCRLLDKNIFLESTSARKVSSAWGLTVVNSQVCSLLFGLGEGVLNVRVGRLVGIKTAAPECPRLFSFFLAAKQLSCHFRWRLTWTRPAFLAIAALRLVGL